MNAKTDNILTESRPLIDTIVILSAEIESLREENKLIRAEMDELHANRREEVSMNKNRGEAYWSAIQQRDEARKDLCRVLSTQGVFAFTPEEIAKHKGWEYLFDDGKSSQPSPTKEEKSDSDPRTGVQYGDLV